MHFDLFIGLELYENTFGFCILPFLDIYYVHFMFSKMQGAYASLVLLWKMCLPWIFILKTFLF